MCAKIENIRQKLEQQKLIALKLRLQELTGKGMGKSLCSLSLALLMSNY